MFVCLFVVFWHGVAVQGSVWLGKGTRSFRLILLSFHCLFLWAGLAGKSKLQEETEYLFGLDVIMLAVNQKILFTSSRNRQEVPVPLQRLSPNPQHIQHLPQPWVTGDPAWLFGGCWQPSAQTFSLQWGPGPDCGQEDIKGQSLRESEPDRPI